MMRRVGFVKRRREITGGTAATMQNDGNLVMYNKEGQAIWRSNTAGDPGGRLVVQDDGNLVIQGASGQKIWATNTAQASVPTGPAAKGNTMQSGEALDSSQPITSENGKYTLWFGSDGNLALHKGRRLPPIWGTKMNGQPSETAIMKNDGNLAIYNTWGKEIWTSNTAGNPGSRLVVQNDGNVVIQNSAGRQIWETKTGPLSATYFSKIIMNPGASITSPNGKYTLSFQKKTGLLAINRNTDGQRIWDSGIKREQPAYLMLNGYIILYEVAHRGNKPYWASNNSEFGSRLALRNDGNLVFENPAGKPVWQTNTGEKDPLSKPAVALIEGGFGIGDSGEGIEALGITLGKDTSLTEIADIRAYGPGQLDEAYNFIASAAENGSHTIIYGHSMGGPRAVELAQRLQKEQYNNLVSLYILDSIDGNPLNVPTVPSNVSSLIVFNQTSTPLLQGSALKLEDPTKTRAEYYTTDKAGHFNIDDHKSIVEYLKEDIKTPGLAPAFGFKDKDPAFTLDTELSNIPSSPSIPSIFIPWPVLVVDPTIGTGQTIPPPVILDPNLGTVRPDTPPLDLGVPDLVIDYTIFNSKPSVTDIQNDKDHQLIKKYVANQLDYDNRPRSREVRAVGVYV